MPRAGVTVTVATPCALTAAEPSVTVPAVKLTVPLVTGARARGHGCSQHLGSAKGAGCGERLSPR